MTLYILVGVHYEERDLVRSLGKDYVQYRRSTPAFVPGLPGASEDLPVRPEASPLHAGR
jgi:methanethiol S-methyltransferase